MGFPLVRLYGFAALALVWHYRASTVAYSGFLASGGYGDCHSPSWLTGAYSGSGFFLKIVGLVSGLCQVWCTGYHFMGEVLVDTDFLLDLEFYARMILISILGLCTENCFQFSRYVCFNIHI